MKKTKRIIKLRASQAVWALVLFFALLTAQLANNIVYELNDMNVGSLIYLVSNFICALAATVLFEQFSRRRVEIDTVNKTLFCKRLFTKGTIALADIKEILNADKLNKKKGFPLSIKQIGRAHV